MVAFTRDALAAAGLPAEDAVIAAKAMIEADVTGFDTHGIFRLSSYIDTLRSGRVNPRANIKVIARSPATALVDGDNGIGHLVMTYAANLAVELARASGIGWVGARRSNHAGAAGTYAEIPLAHGMVGIYAAVSTANHMAPWGGAEALMGTNPIAIAIPAGREPAVVLDIATSVSSFGTIRKYALAGEPMPEGWVVNSKSGEPITDPKKVSEGVLLPIGGYKGSGLALMIGLLAGVLNGAAFGREVIDFTAARHGAEQHRAVRIGARCRAFHADRGVRGRGGPPSSRFALLAAAARRGRDPDARRGPQQTAGRPQPERRSASRRAGQATRRASGSTEGRAARSARGVKKAFVGSSRPYRLVDRVVVLACDGSGLLSTSQNALVPDAKSRHCWNVTKPQTVSSPLLAHQVVAASARGAPVIEAATRAASTRVVRMDFSCWISDL